MTPSLAMIPSAYADSKLYSVLPNNGDGDFTFNRDSSATRVGSNGLIQTSSYYGSELVTNGEGHDIAGWTSDNGATLTTDGTEFKITADGTSLPLAIRSISCIVGKMYTVKANLRRGTCVNGVKVDISGIVGFPEIDSTSNVAMIHQFTATSTTHQIEFYIKGSTTNGETAFFSDISVKEVLGDQPRLDYTDGSCPSLLLEPASTNLVTYSEDFSNSSWHKSSSSVTSGIISPDGTTNAHKLVENTSLSTHHTRDGVTIITGVDYTFSFFAKAAGRSFVSYKLAGAQNTTCYFDLGNGTTLGDGGGEYTLKIEDYGDGWYRCSAVSSNPLNGTSVTVRIYISPDGTSNSYTGDGTSGIYIWGAQLEELSYPTSYIPTSGSTVTRTAETCNGAGDATTFNSSEGVLYVEVATLADLGTRRQISISDGTISNYVTLAFDSDGNLYARAKEGNLASYNYDLSINSKAAVRWGNEIIDLYVDGELKVSSTYTGVLSGMDRLGFSQYSSSNPFYGNCKDIRVYNTALTDDQLIALTTL